MEERKGEIERKTSPTYTVTKRYKERRIAKKS